VLQPTFTDARAATQRGVKVQLGNARHECIGAVKEEIQVPRAFPTAAVYVSGIACFGFWAEQENSLVV